MLVFSLGVWITPLGVWTTLVEIDEAWSSDLRPLQSKSFPRGYTLSGRNLRREPHLQALPPLLPARTNAPDGPTLWSPLDPWLRATRAPRGDPSRVAPALHQALPYTAPSAPPSSPSPTLESPHALRRSSQSGGIRQPAAATHARADFRAIVRTGRKHCERTRAPGI